MRSSRTFRALLLSLAAALFAPSALAQTFAQPTVIPTGSWPRQVLTGDFDGDGNPDLLYLQFVPGTPAGQNDTLVKIAFGDGSGNFSAPVQQGMLNSAISLVVNVADVNADGITDMFYAQGASTGPSTFGVWFGDRSRTLQTPSAYTQRWLTGNSLSQIVGFPLNTYISRDPTLIVLDSTRTATVFTYTLGLLRPVLSFALPDGAGPAVATDVNGDGVPDIVVLGQPSGTIDVFLTSSQLHPYSPQLRFPVTGIHSFLIQDVNFDGIPDLIAEGAQGRIDVYPGNGDGTFQTQSLGGTGTLDGTTGNGGHLIAVADLNHDGLPDALAITPAGVSVLLGNGTAYLGLKGIYNAGPTGGSGHPSYVTADFNHDGFLDLAVDSPEGIAILFGVGDGTFQTSRAFAAGAPAQSSALGSFTASGHMDAAVAINSAEAQLMLGQGDGTFIAAPAPTSTQPASPSLWSSIAVADFNNDGKLDLAITADGAPAHLPGLGIGTIFQYGMGDGTFAAPTGIVSHTNPSSPAYFGTSIAAPGLGLSGKYGLAELDSQHLWTISDSNQPPGPFATAIASVSDPHAHNLIAAGSLYGGTLPDLIAEDEGSLKLYLNSPTGFASTAAGDLAVDGSLTTPGRAVAPALGPTFGGVVPVSSGGVGFPAAIGSMVIADLDGDGNNDLLVAYDNMGADHTAPNSTNYPNYIYIWYGSGGGKFLATAKHPINPLILTPFRNNYQLAIADLNGDKIPDLIMSDGYVITVAYGVGDGTFGPEKRFLGGQGINTVSVGDVNGDGIPDLILANGGGVLTNPVANHETLATNPDVNTGGITVLLNQTPQTAPLTPASLALALCVDDPGSLFPCSTPLSNTPLVNPITMFYGQVLDGVAVESATNLAGTITFYDGTRIFCTIPANLTGVGAGGNACPTNAGNFHAGNRTVDAVYSGDSTHAASTSNAIAVQVFPDITAATVTSSLNPATVGQPVTFTATVTGNFATPTGTVAFFDGLAQIGTGTLDASGKATFTTSTLAIGSHVITLAYSGTPDFNPAPIAILTQIIVVAATPPPPTPLPPGTFTLTVTPSPITIAVGRTGLLLVTITANGSFAQPVALTCSSTTPETSCDFILPTIPVGGGSTTFELHTSAPHDCGDPTHPYFLGSCTPPPTSTHQNPTLTPRAATLLLPALLLSSLGFKRARRRLRNLPSALTLLLLMALTGLTTLSGCGVCTDLGTQGGRYTFTITATAQGGPVTETQSQTIPLTVIIP